MKLQIRLYSILTYTKIYCIMSPSTSLSCSPGIRCNPKVIKFCFLVAVSHEVDDNDASLSNFLLDNSFAMKSRLSFCALWPLVGLTTGFVTDAPRSLSQAAGSLIRDSSATLDSTRSYLDEISNRRVSSTANGVGDVVSSQDAETRRLVRPESTQRS